MNDLVHNERAKLTATWLNGLSLALFAGGGFGPWLTLLNINAPHNHPLLLSTISAVCILLALGLHLAARLFLGRLRS